MLPPAARPRASDGLQVNRRCLAALALLQVKADLLSLIEACEPGALDRRDVDEHILRSIARLDEAVSLLGIEPFDRAFRHRVTSLHFGDPPHVDPECLSLGSPRRDEVAKARYDKPTLKSAVVLIWTRTENFPGVLDQTLASASRRPVALSAFASTSIRLSCAIASGFAMPLTAATSPARRSSASSNRLRWLKLLWDPSLADCKSRTTSARASGLPVLIFARYSWARFAHISRLVR